MGCDYSIEAKQCYPKNEDLAALKRQYHTMASHNLHNEFEFGHRSWNKHYQTCRPRTAYAAEITIQEQDN